MLFITGQFVQRMTAPRAWIWKVYVHLALIADDVFYTEQGKELVLS